MRIESDAENSPRDLRNTLGVLGAGIIVPTLLLPNRHPYC